MGGCLIVESFRFQTVWQDGPQGTWLLVSPSVLVTPCQPAQGSKTQLEHLLLGAVLFSADEQFDQPRGVGQGYGVSRHLC